MLKDPYNLKFTAGLPNLLGFDDPEDDGWFTEGKYTGDRPVNFALTKTLRLHLGQISTAYNVFDGAHHSPQGH